jgi:hypothetical protein
MSDEEITGHVTRARKLCGCMQCQGGYDIGARTIAAMPANMRPSSCMATTILGVLLWNREDLSHE